MRVEKREKETVLGVEPAAEILALHIRMGYRVEANPLREWLVAELAGNK